MDRYAMWTFHSLLQKKLLQKKRAPGPVGAESGMLEEVMWRPEGGHIETGGWSCRDRVGCVAGTDMTREDDGKV